MKNNPIIAAILSLFIPGLGQIYKGDGGRGAMILIAAIVVGNLNAIWLSGHALSKLMPATFYSQTLPVFLHAYFAFCGVIFWTWQVADAYRT